MTTDCPSENELTRLMEGTLDDASVTTVEAHIGDCPSCAELLAGLAAVLVPEEPAPATEPLITVGERYRVVRLLGRGGMGAVYEAVDEQLGRDVALKVIRPDVARADNRELLERRLLREARSLARLSHPNVVTIYDVGSADGTVFIAFEIVRGKPASAIEHDPKAWRRTVEVYAQAARGLAAAHAAGIVHRDVKPSNLLVGDDGRVRVTDFGLAKGTHVDFTMVETPLTFAGDVVGTPAYMAPEQHAQLVDEKADQFSFCVALYEALYGSRPFAGTTAREVLANAREGKLREPEASDAPRPILEILRQGLAPLPHQRHGSMTELADALDRVGVEKAPPAGSKRVVLAGTVLVAAAAIAVLAFRNGEEAPKQVAEAETSSAATSATPAIADTAAPVTASASASDSVTTAPADSVAVASNRAPAPRPSPSAIETAKPSGLYTQLGEEARKSDEESAKNKKLFGEDADPKTSTPAYMMHGAESALQRGDGKRCLDLLNAIVARPVDGQTAAEKDLRGRVPTVRAMCSMTIGQCDSGAAALTAQGWKPEAIEITVARFCRR